MRAVFLDRDGIINKKMPEGDYVKSWQEFEFLPGVFETLKFLAANDFDIFIVTNQRGVRRGLMSAADLEDIHGKMLEKFRENGVKIKGIYCCTHDENECECRKPKPGMLLQAARDHNLNLAEAVLLGDSESDRAAAKAAGCRGILINSNSPEELHAAVNGLIKSHYA